MAQGRKRKCKGKTKAGKPCRAVPMRKGAKLESVEGFTSTGKWCRAHDPNLPASARFGSMAQAAEAAKLGGRPRTERAPDLMKRLLESHVEAVLAPHFRTLGYDVRRNAENELELVQVEGGGAKIYGESKDGEIRMTSHDDLGAMIAAAEKLLDRIYGRAKQTTETIGGGERPPGEVPLIPADQGWHDTVAGVLAGVGAVQGQVAEATSGKRNN